MTIEPAYYWSRVPGKFVNKKTGNPVTLAATLGIGPVFTGGAREWYETLVETIYDVTNELAKRATDDRPISNRVYAGPNVFAMLECSVMWRPNDLGGRVSDRFYVLRSPAEMDQNVLYIDACHDEEFRPGPAFASGRVAVLDMPTEVG